MNNNYHSFFDSIYEYTKGTTMAAWVFLLSLCILAIGINNFAEDTYSSYVGIQMIEKTYNVRPASWELTYWAMSISFQVITVLLMFAYLSNKQRYWWAFWAAFGAQAVDFFSDTWYRANGTWTGWTGVIISVILTFLFFTVGSEFAVTIGLGLTARMFVEGMAQLGILVRNIFAGILNLGQILASGFTSDKGATHPNITKGTQDIKFTGNPNASSQPYQKPNNPPQQPRPANFQPPNGGKPPVVNGKPDGGNPPTIKTETMKFVPNQQGNGGMDPALAKLLKERGVNSDGSPRSDQQAAYAKGPNKPDRPFQGQGGEMR